jgi:NitT/TauT family transport system ATP-binding protein
VKEEDRLMRDPMVADRPAPTGGGNGLISFREVGQIFPLQNSEVVALRDINLDVQPGQFVALVGASGCGKTTLLNMLAGLVRPTTGSVILDGKPPRLPNMDIGYMFARDALLPWRTAQRNVELPLETRGWSRSERSARARQMLKLVGLEGRERQFRLQLSQGMRQRVALARTFASDPSILLMDEPFAALDARTKLTLQAEFLRIWELHQGSDMRKTVIFVTHDLEEATLLADRVVVMLPNPGRIAEDKLIDLPRPRAERLSEMLFDDRFRHIAHGLFERLEGAIDTPVDRADPEVTAP